MSLKNEVDVAYQLYEKYPVQILSKEVLDIQTLLEGPELPNASLIKKLVSVNPAMAGDLVALANDFSMKSAHPQRIQTIDAAIDFLGMNQIKNYVYSIQVKTFMDQGPIRGLTYHSISVAQVLMSLSQKVRLLNQSQAYLFGLIHDIGTFILSKIDPMLPETFVGSLPNHYKLHENEYERFGTSHSALSYVVAKEWGLDDAMCKAILLHHQKDLKRVKDDRVQKLTALLELAHCLVLEEHTDLNKTEAKLMFDDSLNILSMSEDTLTDMRYALAHQAT